MVNGFNRALCRPDQDQFEAEPVLTTDGSLLVFVVIGRSAQMTENHLGNPQTVFRMLRNINAVTVVLDYNQPIRRNGRLNSRHDFFVLCFGLNHTDNVVTSIDNAFIEEFV